MIYFVDESHLTTLQVQAKSIKRSSIHAKSEIDPERAYFDILCIFQVGTRCPSSVSLRFFLFSAFLALSQRSQMQSLQVLLFWVGADTSSHKLLCFPCFCTRFLGFLMQLGPSEWTFLHEISWASYIFSDFFQKVCCWHTAKWCRTCPKSWRIRMTEARKKMRGNWDAIQLVIFIDIQIIHNYSFERTTVSPIFSDGTTLVVSIAAQVTVMATTERMKIGGRREISLKVLKSSHLRRQKVLENYADGNLTPKEVHLNLQNVFALSTRAMERLQGFKACKTFLRGHMVRKDFQYGIRSFFFQHNLAIRVTYNVRNIYTVYSTSIQSIHSRSECFGFFQIFDTEVWICRNQKIRKTDYHDHQLPIHCEPPATNSSNMRKLWDSGNGS